MFGREGRKAQLLIKGEKGVCVRMGKFQILGVEFDVKVFEEGNQLTAQLKRIEAVFDFLSDALLFYARKVFEQSVERIEPGNQRLGCLLSDPGDTGDIV